MHRPKLKMPAPLSPSPISNLQEQVEGSISSRATSDRYVTRTPISRRSGATAQSMHRRVASQPSNFSIGNSSRGGHRRVASASGTSIPDIRLQPPVRKFVLLMLIVNLIHHAVESELPQIPGWTGADAKVC
jgi:hypothetical protein